MRSKKRNPKCFLSKDAYKCSGQKASYNRNSLRWGYAKGSGTTITENRYIGMTRTKSISQKKSGITVSTSWKNYSVQIEERAKKEHFQLVSIQKLLDEGIIQSFAGHGSPEARFKGLGDIPYVRVAYIMNWSIYKNPTAFIPAFEYQRVKGNGSDLKEGDVLFVRRGSLYLLSHTLTQKQINSKVLTDTTLPTIGDRWKELKLPVANDATRRKE